MFYNKSNIKNFKNMDVIEKIMDTMNLYIQMGIL